jgi:hypothetical protein
MTLQAFQGEMMRKPRILIALIGLAGLGMAAKGQAVDQIVVNIPTSLWSLAKHFRQAPVW